MRPGPDVARALASTRSLLREVLGRDELAGMPQAREPQRTPTVLSHGQVKLVLGHLSGKYRLLGSLMYGTGARLTESHQLRCAAHLIDLRTEIRLPPTDRPTPASNTPPAQPKPVGQDSASGRCTGSVGSCRSLLRCHPRSGSALEDPEDSQYSN